MRRFSSIRLLVVLSAGFAVLGSAGPVALQQQAAQTPQVPTFRTTTSIVEVDVVIHDKKGDFVTGLTADDLELFEDGKAQHIEQFYMVSHERGGQLLPVTGDQAVLPEDRARRIFVVMFDQGHLASDSLMRSKAGVITFINENMGPGDFGGIFRDAGMYNGRLTTSRAELISGVNTVNVLFENRQQLLSTFREFPTIPSEIDALRIADGSLEVAQRVGETNCDDDPQSCEFNGGEQQVENLINRKARYYVRQARLLTFNTLQNLRYVVNRLARIPGRKTLVFLSEGFFVEESRGELTEIAAEAARGGTTIYSIDGRGLIGSPSATPDVVMATEGRSTAFDTGESAPNILTAATGGIRIQNVDNISRAFNMVVRDTSTYYVVGYRPDNAKMDGTFRKIEVKAKVAGVKVRARKGYLATTLPPLEAIRGSWK